MRYCPGPQIKRNCSSCHFLFKSDGHCLSGKPESVLVAYTRNSNVEVNIIFMASLFQIMHLQFGMSSSLHYVVSTLLGITDSLSKHEWADETLYEVRGCTTSTECICSEAPRKSRENIAKGVSLKYFI